MRIPFFKKKDKEESEAKRNRRLIVELVFKSVMLFMFGLALLYTIISFVLGSSLFVPSSGSEVLQEVQTPSSYGWTVENVRLVELGAKGNEEEQIQEGVRSSVIDVPENIFQVQTTGVLPEKEIYTSDGNLTIGLSESAAESDESWTQITDFCNGDPSISTSTLEIPSTKSLLETNPEIATDEGTFLGERAWVINFTPSPEILKQLLWTDFFDQAVDAREREWALSSSDLEEIENGNYQIDFGRIWVTRDAKELRQIDTRFILENGSKWRILATMYPFEERPIADKDLGTKVSEIPEENPVCQAEELPSEDVNFEDISN